MSEQTEQHDLIDQYLKKPWYTRLFPWFVRGLIFLAVASLVGFYLWHRLPDEEQAGYRQQYPTLDRLVTYLEDAAATDETRAADPEPEAVAQTGKPAPPRRPTQPEQEETPVIDMTDQPISMSDTAVRTRPPKTDEATPPLVPASDPEEEAAAQTEAERARLERRRKIEAWKAKRQAARDERLSDEEERADELEDRLKNGALSITWNVWHEDRPLTWDDFEVVDDRMSAQGWGANITTNMILSRNRRGQHIALAYMVPQRSWIAPDQRSDTMLRRVQLTYDLAELFARHVRTAIDTEWPDKIGNIFLEKHAQMMDAQAKARRAIAADPAALEIWEQKVGGALEQLKKYGVRSDPKSLANKGYGAICFWLGTLYEHGGFGFEPSERLARKWYNQAIGLDVTEAMNNLAAMHQRGDEDEEPNYRKALRLYRRASGRDSAAADFNLGVLYWHGLGTETDRDKAMDYFTKSADKITYARTALNMLEKGESFAGTER